MNFLTGSGSSGGSVVPGPNGAVLTTTYIDEFITIAAAVTSLSATNLIPANAFIRAILLRVTVAIPTAATFSIGVTGNAALFGSGIAVTLNTVSNSWVSATLVAPFLNSAADKILITPNSTPATAVGRIHVVTFYDILTNMSS